MTMCLYFSYLTHFSGKGRNPSNNFVAFLENLRHRNFVLRLSVLYHPLSKLDDYFSYILLSDFSYILLFDFSYILLFD